VAHKNKRKKVGLGMFSTARFPKANALMMILDILARQQAF